MRIFIVATLVAFVVCAYMAGLRIGAERCRADAAHNASVAVSNIINQERKADAQTYGLDTGNIRRILREKYTIAQ